MKFDCGLPLDERKAFRDAAERKRLSQWHPFFALLPRRLGATECVWLEWIRRKGQYYDNGYHGGEWRFEYREAVDRSL